MNFGGHNSVYNTYSNWISLLKVIYIGFGGVGTKEEIKGENSRQSSKRR